MEESRGVGRLQKMRYSDTAVPFKTFIDPSEFPLVEGWDNANMGFHQANGRASLHPNNLSSVTTGFECPTKAQRQPSLGGITDSSLSSGFASDLSSAAATTRYPSFSFASVEPQDAGDLSWFSPSETKAELPKTPKKTESGSGNQKKNRRFVDARQRSGSMAVGSVSGSHQSEGPQQRSMSFSFPLASGGPGGGAAGIRHQFNTNGNIFRQRKDFSVFQQLQAWKRNGYFIQLEDDSCTGNEDTRAFVLCQLTAHGAAEVPCLACGRSLPIYDHFPLLDGALFLTPLCHRGGLQVSWNVPLAPSSLSTGSSSNLSSTSSGSLMKTDVIPPPGCTGPRQQQQQMSHHGHHNSGRHHRVSVSQKRFLHAVCMACMRSIDTDSGSGDGGPTKELPHIVCKFCHASWGGATLLIGGLYTYDLFACSPCCKEHLRCKSCGQQPLSRGDGEKSPDSTELHPLPYFSQYSQLLCCQHCRAVDYHFIKPFETMYDVRVPS